MSVHHINGEMIRGIKIPADDSQPITHVDIPIQYPKLKEFLGGWVERVHTATMPVMECGCHTVLIVDEEGVMKRLPQNRRATIYYQFAYGILGDAYLVGEGLVTSDDGFPDLDFVGLIEGFEVPSELL